MNLDQDSNFPDSLVKDREVHKSSKEGQFFLSLTNGILSLKKDGTWEWSERPE